MKRCKKIYKIFSIAYDVTAKMLQLICVIIFDLIFIIFAYVLILALFQGAIPYQWWEVEGNHGPWRYHYDLRRWLNFLFLTCFVSFWSGLAAFCFQPKWTTGIITILSLVLFFLFIFTLHWLID